MTLSATVFCSSCSRCLDVLTHFCKLSSILYCSLAKFTGLHSLVKFASSAESSKKFFSSAPPLFRRVRGPLAEFWAVTQCGCCTAGGIALQHYRAHPSTECLYQDPLLLRLHSFTRSSNEFIWSRLSRKKMRRRPFLLPPCPSLSFHFRFHLRPFNTGGGLACRPPPPSACTGWLSAGSWTWSIGPLGRGRLVGGEIHSEYQDQAALAAPAGLTGQDAKGKKAIGYN